MWTYKKSYDKLSEAYIKGEVNPWNPCFCMVGNLLGGGEWVLCRDYSKGISVAKVKTTDGAADYIDEYRRSIKFINDASEGTYTPLEIAEIEAVFMGTYQENRGSCIVFGNNALKPTPKDEEALWLAFVAGLEKIKEIHVSKGEDVDQEIALPKRYEKAVV